MKKNNIRPRELIIKDIQSTLFLVSDFIKQDNGVIQYIDFAEETGTLSIRLSKSCLYNNQVKFTEKNLLDIFEDVVPEVKKVILITGYN